MKVVILAGGFGTRLSEETTLVPKPMLDIGTKPILWHIMKTYSFYGFNEFIILLGYKGYLIKEYFANYFLHQSDVKINIKNNSMDILNNSSEPWIISLIDTGLDTMTGGRIKKVENLIGNETFLMTYGDGVSDVNIQNVLDFHNTQDQILTITSSQPDGRFGALELENDSQVRGFYEKPKGDGGWINAGYFVCKPEIFNFIVNDKNCVFEQAPLSNLANAKQINTFKHSGFWMPMDTLRDKNKLNKLWESGSAPWKVWD